jgi:hypothetical protein
VFQTIKSLFFVLLFLSTMVLAQTMESPKILTRQSGNVKKHWVEGSLASTQTIGCIPLAEAKNTFTPPDLYKGVEACVAQDNYNLAVRLFVLAGMYSWFDADRITDESAAQARTILITNTFAAMPEGKKAKFSEALDPLTKNPDPALVEKLCDEVEKVGAPNYYPSYMILHGIKAFTGNPHKEALIKDFGAATAWKSLQSEYLHCPD